MANDAGVMAVDHMGFSVGSLEDALQFWTEAMGFVLVRQSEMGGAFLRETTGVEDPRCRMALVKDPNGFAVELLEYSTGHELGRVPRSSGAIGSAHLAVTVVDIRRAVGRVETAGWQVKGLPQQIPGGPRSGTIVAYVAGPDGITIELMQPPV
ncbi:VOC family protein [Lichenifustis flavocetrariae]|uniref:VOC family protein n=1 Tax=Lichenifustis flavocetrariae TaxID=2949735 RepID=A0AA42CM26_9HYPH|nr:VOC family protein [Lichenifustis flavocetrariae]MCW6507925.1 VOC family protein [Lichenifustis flavocetrariae]